MTLKSQIIVDESVFFDADDFAEAAVYNGESILVIETVASEKNTGIPGFTVPMFTVLLSSADVSRPKAGDTVTFRGSTFNVGSFPESEGGMWKVDLLKDTVQI